MNWYQITIHTVSEAVEAISYMLEELGFQGVEIMDPRDILWQEKDPTSWDYIDEELLAGMNTDEVLVSCYRSFAAVTNETELESLQLTIAERLKQIASFLPIGSGRLEVSVKNEDDWANAWKKYYKPFHLGHHIYIVPTWVEEDAEQEGDIKITMDPGMAFGTGTHETTSMCITMLEELVHAGDTVFDIGCGSGILSITAAKVGAGRVVGSDLDANAVRVAKENVAMNRVGNTTEIYLGDLLEVPVYKQQQADIVVSNIIADVIIGLAPNVRPVIKDGGYFICSGIIRERREDVEKALRDSGYVIQRVMEKGSWVAIVSAK